MFYITEMSRWTKRRKINAAVARDILDTTAELGLVQLDNLGPSVTFATAVHIPAAIDYAVGPSNHNNNNNSDSESSSAICSDPSDYIDYDDSEILLPDSDSEGDDSLTNDICGELAAWAKNYDISLISLSALLVILKPHFLELPKDALTAKATDNEVEMAMKEWLKFATERDGRRRERARSKPASQHVTRSNRPLESLSSLQSSHNHDSEQSSPHPASSSTTAVTRAESPFSL